MLVYRVFGINNYHLQHFAPILVRGQNGSEGSWLNKLMPLWYKMC